MTSTTIPSTGVPRVSPQDFTITQLTTSDSVLQHIEQLSLLLQQCVNEGNSIGFYSPLSIEDASAYWTALIPSVTAGTTHLFILTAPSPPATRTILIGTVQLAPMQKATHAHRADINKLLISSSYRRRGIARALMEHAEAFARRQGLEVLTLTTAKESAAREMYRALGWEEFGVCRNYASWPDGRRVDVSFFMRDL